MLTLQGKHTVAKVLAEVFSVTKLRKIFQQTSTTNFATNHGSLNRCSIYLKNFGQEEVLAKAFYSVHLDVTHTSAC